MGTIPVKLQAELIEKLDVLVRVGKFKNRSEAIRQILKQYLEREPMVPLSSEARRKKISSVVNMMLAKKKPVFAITSRKTAAELVAEGRER